MQHEFGRILRYWWQCNSLLDLVRGTTGSYLWKPNGKSCWDIVPRKITRSKVRLLQNLNIKEHNLFNYSFTKGLKWNDILTNLKMVYMMAYNYIGILEKMLVGKDITRKLST